MQIFKENNVSRIAFKWSTIFFLIGIGLIYTSDLILNQQISDIALYSTYQTYKGIAFFSIVSVVFFFIIRHLLSQTNKKNESLLYALEAGNMATWDFDVDTEEVTHSKNHHTLYGYQYRPEAWSLSRFLNHVSKENRAEIKKELIEAVNGGGKIDKEFKIKTADGKTSWRWLRGKVEYNTKNQPTRVSGVVIDVDDRKETEQKLKKEEQFIEVSINSVPGIFFVLDNEGHMIRWNDNANKVSGLTDEELKNLHVIERVEEEDREKAKEALGKVLTEGEVQTELALKTKEQGKSIFKITASRFESNGMLFLVGTGIDITELIEKQEKVRRQNYQLQTAQNIAKIGYWENDLRSDSLNWTDTVYQLFGLDKEKFNLTTENFVNLVHPVDRDSLLKNQEHLKQSGSFESEYRILKPDGSIGWFRETGEAFKWENGKPQIIHGIIMDITQQKEAERKTRKSLLEGENRERKRIANELHDGIAQYLSSALLHFDGAENALDNIKQDYAQKLWHARKLIKDALIETRTISQNLMPKSIEKYGLSSAIKSLIEQYRVSTDILFKWNFNNLDSNNQLPRELEVNLYRIMQELLSNSVRHSGCDTIWIEVRRKAEKLTCIVKDNGTAAALPEISESKGSGLKSIHNRVQLFSGSVQFDNTSSKGLQVTVNIPLR